MTKRKLYRAHFCKSDGTYGIHRCEKDFLPDGKTYFATFRQAHTAVIEQYAQWLDEERKHLRQLKKLNTKEKWRDHHVCSA